jgi:hypothetical protein
MADIEIIRQYVDKIQRTGGGLIETDMDDSGEGL